MGSAFRSQRLRGQIAQRAVRGGDPAAAFLRGADVGAEVDQAIAARASSGGRP
jgi:hypothetical protein